MKYMHQQFRKGLRLAILFVICLTMNTLVFCLIYQKVKNTYIQGELVSQQAMIQSITQSYRDFSDYIMETSIQTPDVYRLMKTANTDDETVKMQKRNELLSLLRPSFEAAQKYHFSQLSFQLPDGESFLRFHAPEKYGDYLMEIRASVRIANEDRVFVEGFEEGRTYNGYRFVYPLLEEGNHYGSVELSVSVATMIQSLQELLQSKDMYFIVEREIVEDTVFQSIQDQYIESYLSENYLMDREIVNQLIQHKSKEATEYLLMNEVFSQAINEAVGDQLKRNQSFGVEFLYDKKIFTAYFTQIMNIDHQPIGYFVSIGENAHLVHLKKYRIGAIVLLTLIEGLILALCFVLKFAKRQEVEQEVVDHLTHNYNRHTFFEFAYKEYYRSLRSAKPFSIAIFSVDYLRRIHDDYGRVQGDKVLKELADLISTNIRKSDIFAHFSGDEFILMMPEISEEVAFHTTDRLRGYIGQHRFELGAQVTVSIGISEMIEHEESLEVIIERASEALYHAKMTGKNKVVAYRDIKRI